MSEEMMKGIGKAFLPPTQEQPGVTLTLRGVIVEELKGVVRIRVPGTPLSEQDRMILSKLFPNLLERVFVTLDQEAVLSAVCTEEEAAQAMREKDA